MITLSEILLMISAIAVLISLAYGWKVQKWLGHLSPATWMILAGIVVLVNRILLVLSIHTEPAIFDEIELWFGPIFAPVMASVFLSASMIHLYYIMRKFTNGGSLLKSRPHKDKE